MELLDYLQHACQAVNRNKKVMLGDRKIVDNPFLWFEVVIKLLGHPVYQSDKPYLSKSREDSIVAFYISI